MAAAPPPRPARAGVARTPAKLLAPDKDAILAMPRWPDVPLEAVRVPAKADEVDAALADLRAQRFVGFDTETKPVFVKTNERLGPDLVQFATTDCAYLFQLANPLCKAAVTSLLGDERITKIGFGLSGDQRQLQLTLGVAAKPVIDLDNIFRRMGYIKELGIKSAVAVVFGQRLVKSKRVTTTNWASPVLSAQQRIYAANDALVALRVWEALELDKYLEERGTGRG